MALFALSIGQLVLTSASIIISLAILFFSVLSSIWINTAAAGLTIIFHLVTIYRALIATRRAKKEMSGSLEAITDTTCSIAVGTVLASTWVVCFALTTDITVEGPTMNMGRMINGLVDEQATIRQLVLTAVESLLMVFIVVLAVQERRALKVVDEERSQEYDYPTKS